MTLDSVMVNTVVHTESQACQKQCFALCERDMTEHILMIFLIVGALVTCAIYTQGNLLL